MGKIVFILGDMRSGKTAFVFDRVKKCKQSITYIATGVPVDSEMQKRIKEHKKNRPHSWKTIEEPIEIITAIKQLKTKIVILDCINFWLHNVLKKCCSGTKNYTVYLQALLSNKAN